MKSVDSSSSPIFILHGWAIDPHNEQKWSPLISALEKSGLEVHFLPLPGLTTSLNEPWTLSDYEMWLKEQLKGQTGVILLGHSFGGQLAIRYTAHHCDQVRELILIDASGMRPRSLKSKIKRSVFWLAAKSGQAFTQSENIRKVLYKLAREKDYQTASPHMRKTMANVLADEIVEDLPNVEVPTLLIWGANDAATPLAHGKLYADLLPKSTLEVIADARHSPQFTHTEQVAEIVAGFIKNKG